MLAMDGAGLPIAIGTGVAGCCVLACALVCCVRDAARRRSNRSKGWQLQAEEGRLPRHMHQQQQQQQQLPEQPGRVAGGANRSNLVAASLGSKMQLFAGYQAPVRRLDKCAKQKQRSANNAQSSYQKITSADGISSRDALARAYGNLGNRVDADPETPRSTPPASARSSAAGDRQRPAAGNARGPPGGDSGGRTASSSSAAKAAARSREKGGRRRPPPAASSSVDELLGLQGGPAATAGRSGGQANATSRPIGTSGGSRVREGVDDVDTLQREYEAAARRPPPRGGGGGGAATTASSAAANAASMEADMDEFGGLEDEGDILGQIELPPTPNLMVHGLTPPTSPQPGRRLRSQEDSSVGPPPPGPRGGPEEELEVASGSGSASRGGQASSARDEKFDALDAELALEAEVGRAISLALASKSSVGLPGSLVGRGQASRRSKTPKRKERDEVAAATPASEDEGRGATREKPRGKSKERSRQRSSDSHQDSHSR